MGSEGEPDSPSGEAPAHAVLELVLPPEDVPKLLRASPLLARRDGRLRTVPASIVWHDTPDGSLAADNLALSHGTGTGAAPDIAWRLERLHPNGQLDWLPANAAPMLAEGAAPGALGRILPAALAPVAAFRGTLRQLRLRAAGGTSARLAVLDGMLRGVTQDRADCRVFLHGDAIAVASLAGVLADSVRLTVPRAGLAAQAIAVARGTAPAPRYVGPPTVAQAVSLDDALALVTAQLADTILYWGALVPGRQTAEPVHQMRVAVRRLRSALSVFRRAVQDEAGQAPWLDTLQGDLKALAGRLGAARDWDVFLDETGAEIGQAFAGDPRIVRLLAVAARRRDHAYGDLLEAFGAPDWTRLALALGLLPTLRPWRLQAAPGTVAGPVAAFVPRALNRRLKHTLSPGQSLQTLSAHELHDVRKQAKRLRYAIEPFAHLFADKAVRKYTARLEKLQKVLGTANDSAVAAALMAQLGGGADRAFAAGVVQGFGAGRAGRTTAKVRQAWTRFTRADPFWD